MRRHFLAIAVILTVPTGCDNVAWGGIEVRVESPEPVGEASDRAVHALFVLISPQHDVRAHLNLLARLAGRADDDSFMPEWLAAKGEQDLKEALLHDERFLSLHLETSGPTADLVDREVRNVRLEPGALIALIHRDGEVLVPGGRTALREGDRLTIVGSVEAIRALTDRFETD